MQPTNPIEGLGITVSVHGIVVDVAAALNHAAAMSVTNVAIVIGTCTGVVIWPRIAVIGCCDKNTTTCAHVSFPPSRRL
jgi:hypothetical protein